MNAHDRVITALSLEEPDRVPLFELIINGAIMEKILRRPCFPCVGWGIEADPQIDRKTAIEKQIKDHVECYKKLKLDMLSIFPAAPNNWKNKKIEREKQRSFVFTDEWGVTYKYNPTIDQSFVVDVPIKTIDDLENYSFPDPLADGRTDYLDYTVKLVRSELAIAGWVPGIVEHTWTKLLGLRNFAIFLYRYPGKMEKFLDKMTKFIIELGKSLVDAGADVIFYGNDTAGKNGPIISPELHRKFFVPRLREITYQLKKKNIFIANHTDGNIYPILDDLISTGINGLHGIEPQAGMSLSEVKSKYGGQLCLIGNVDVSKTLPFGTRRDVMNEVLKCLKDAAPGGGYILSSSNSLTKGIPVGNIYTMYNTAIKYGKYPIRI